jgi:alpha,alpha-trehalase
VTTSDGATGARPDNVDRAPILTRGRVVIDPRYHDGVLFDLDGVVTDTAKVHAAAWSSLFDDFLGGRTAAAGGGDTSPFTNDDYRHFVDGKPRSDGVTDFLASRGISLPRGRPTDTGDDVTVYGLGNHKQRLFRRLLTGGVPVFDSTVVLVRRLRDLGIGVALYSSSRNCADVLIAAGIDDLFDVRVDGVLAEELGLAGKPDPAMLVEAAGRLTVRPDRCVVIEDAEAGVTAGRDGGFALVIGVARSGNADDLLRCGADVVVADAADISVRVDDHPVTSESRPERS